MSIEKLYQREVFLHPFTCIIAGPSGSGKTKLLLNIILRSKEMIKPTPDRIIYCYSCWQKVFENIKNIEFHEGCFDIDDVDEKKNNLIIFDDLMEEVNNDKSVQNLFTKGSHHKNISVFLLTQNLFAKGKFTRTINLNSHYSIIFDNPRDRSQISHFARQMYPNNSKFLVESYMDAINIPHGYLFIDNKQGTPEEIRVQTKITNPIRIVYKIKN